MTNSLSGLSKQQNKKDLLNSQAQITEVNFTGAGLLGVEKQNLLQQRFAPFVVPEDKDRWYLHFLLVLQHDTKRNCEVTLQRFDGSRLDVRLDSVRLVIDDTFTRVRLVVSDIIPNWCRSISMMCLKEHLSYWSAIRNSRTFAKLQNAVLSTTHTVIKLYSAPNKLGREEGSENAVC